ncbi:Uncharacterised protein [Pantoea agglomerans]|uniref:Uncharacterized protein n=1 Tax=Enterobacter agglomerans TaxID=549 RepID=A0A379AEY2_ENTAG|nr:Uncharacterised protein [Pantoea agglomerans]
MQLRNHRLVHDRQGIALGELYYQFRHRIGRPPQVVQIFQNGVVAEVAGGNVNGDMERGIVGNCGKLSHHLIQYKARQRFDQVLSLGQGNKDIRCNPALTGIMPAQQ